MKNKIKTKNKINKNKTAVSHADDLGDGMILIKEEKGKCLVIFPIWPHARDAFDGDLGFIAILMMKGINYNDVCVRTSEIVYEDDQDPEELVYTFDNKYTKKIKAIEKAWFAHKIKVDAKSMSDFIMYQVNYLSPENWRKNLIKK
jgi:hypothetical protein